MDRGEIFRLIETERNRQEKIHPFPVNDNKEQSPEVQMMTNLIVNNEFLSVLVEEVGEVGAALQGEGVLKDELIQVASVAIRWLEKLK